MVKNITLSIILLFSLCLISASWASEGVYNAPKTDKTPVIDGIGTDTCWNKASWAPISNVWIGSAVPAEDYSGKFKVLWTEDKLYVLVELVDDSLRCQSTFDVNNIYNFDCVEIFIDENRSRETNYSGTYKAFAYHMDTTGHVAYARGNYGWEVYTDHITMKVGKVAPHTYDWEFEVKVFDDTYSASKTNVPETLTVGRWMGWSVAYNDNDLGNSRQNMFGSKYIAGKTDNEKNISYFNASAFGDLNLVLPEDTGKVVVHNNAVKKQSLNQFECFIANEEMKLKFKNLEAGKYIVQIFDITGRPVIIKEMFRSFGQDDDIDISSLRNGIYLVKTSGEGKNYTSKVLFLR